MKGEAVGAAANPCCPQKNNATAPLQSRSTAVQIEEGASPLANISSGTAGISMAQELSQGMLTD